MSYWERSQPIELVWSYVKNYVARRYHPARTSAQLREHIHEGMYGSPDDKHTGLTPELIQKLIPQTPKYINDFLVNNLILVLGSRDLVGVLITREEVNSAPTVTQPINSPCMGAVIGPSRA